MLGPGWLPLSTVVDGNPVFDVTDVPMVAVETRTEVPPTTEATGMLDAVGMATTQETTLVELVAVATETGGCVAGSEEAIAVAVTIGETDVVDGVVVVPTVAEETTLVFMIGVTTCGEVVLTKTAATGT